MRIITYFCLLIFLLPLHEVQALDNELPKELLHFSGQVTDESNHFQWEIASNSHELQSFYLLRSDAPEGPFDIISVMDAALDPKSNIVYKYQDQSPLNETSYYQLVIYYKNGDNAFSDVIELNRIQSEAIVQLFPIPATSYTYLELNLPADEKAQVYLFDYQGRQVAHWPNLINDKHRLPLDNLAIGAYHLVVQTKSVKINKNFIKK